MFNQLKNFTLRPEPFSVYTAEQLWNTSHIARQMLKYHLNETVDISSRRIETIKKSVNWMVDHFNLGDQTTLIDFGCGPGLYTTEFAKSGMQVSGIDFSSNSILYANKMADQAGLSIKYINRNYLDFSPEQKYDFITMIMYDFCALSPLQRKRLFSIFQRALQPDGIIVFDLLSLPAFLLREETQNFGFRFMDGFWAEEDYFVFQNTFKYEESKLMLDKYTIIKEKETVEIYNWLQHFSPESIREEVEANGFQIVEMHGDLIGLPYQPDLGEFAVVIKKA